MEEANEEAEGEVKRDTSDDAIIGELHKGAERLKAEATGKTGALDLLEDVAIDGIIYISEGRERERGKRREKRNLIIEEYF